MNNCIGVELNNIYFVMHRFAIFTLKYSHCTPRFFSAWYTLCDRCTASENVVLYTWSRQSAIYTCCCFRYTPLRCYALLNIRFGEPSKQALQFAFTCSILLLIDLRFAMPANPSDRFLILQRMPFHTRTRVHDELPICNSPPNCNDCHDKDLRV